MDYLHDPKKIYNQSFAIIRKEADLSDLPNDIADIVVRLIHACGMIDILEDLEFSFDVAQSAKLALNKGAPILCDTRMVSEGITRARLSADNEVICTLQHPDVPQMAKEFGNTRSATALELWRPYLDGAVVAIGNAPTALFHLLNMLEDKNCPKPAAIIGCPVGFVGASESKDALMNSKVVPSCIVKGRLGGSAITVAAINALASRIE